MSCFGSKDSSGAMLDAQKAQSKAVNIATGQIRDQFAGFNPAFYSGIAKSYQNYAMPQLQQQYKTMSDQVGFKLANQGLQKSSQAQGLYGGLNDAMKQAQTQIGQQGQNYANQMRQQVAQQEGNLISMAQTANQPGQIIPQTLASVSSLQGPSSFAPIGQMLNSWGNMALGNQQAQMGQQMQAMYQPYQQQFLGGYGGTGGGSFIPSNTR